MTYVGGQRTICGSCSFLPPYGSQELNSGWAMLYSLVMWQVQKADGFLGKFINQFKMMLKNMETR